MKLRKNDWGFLLLCGISFAVALYFYPQMPVRMVTHWGVKGNPNGYSSRLFGTFFMPITMFLLTLLFITIPHIDPLKKNLKASIEFYDIIAYAVLLFLLVMQFYVYLQNKGVKLNVTVIVTIGISALFFIVGIALPHIRRNFFAGIRTPWTLSDDTVWEKTHELGGKLFVISAFVILATLVVPRYFLLILIIVILFAAVYTIFYSYFLYAKLHSEN